MLIELILVAGMASAVAESDCLRFAEPVNISRIRKHPQISAIQRVNNSKFHAVALLKNGGALRIAHIACYDSGVSLALWTDGLQKLPKFADVDAWLTRAISAANIAFEPRMAAEFTEAVKAGTYKIHEQESRLEVSITGRHGSAFSMAVDSELPGALLTIDYLIKG